MNQKWNRIILMGGIAAILAAILFRRWWSAELLLFHGMGLINYTINPETTDILEWYKLLQTQPIIGLILLNALDIVNYFLVALMYIACFLILFKDNKIFIIFAGMSLIIGLPLYLSGNQSFNLLSLSNQYFISDTINQKHNLIAAGQLALNLNNPVIFGIGIFWSYIFLYLSGLLISLSMLKNSDFGKPISILGVVSCSIGLGYFITSAISPKLGFIPAISSAPLNLIWYMLIGIKLIKLSKRPLNIV